MNDKDDKAENMGIQLKGTNFGIRVIFPNEIGDDVLLKILTSFQASAFILPIGRGVVLDFQARPCSERLIARILHEVVWPKKLNVLAWLTTDENSSKRLCGAGFCVTEPDREQDDAIAKPELEQDDVAVKPELEHADVAVKPGSRILDHSLRSGRHEEHDGDLVLVGHLNEGAELFAGGSVFVLGRMKGLVHAGRNGTDGVCVVTGSFETRQVRVGDKLCDHFGPEMKWWKKPVIITLEEDGLLFREWTYQ